VSECLIWYWLTRVVLDKWRVVVVQCLQTALPPLTQMLLHWDELQNSILYCGASVEVFAL